MNKHTHSDDRHHHGDAAPGDEGEGSGLGRGLRGYIIGLVLASALTIVSFWAASTHLIYGPSIPMALSALAVAQMGIHLVFFLHITTAPDNTNNILALAFGLFIVCLVVLGSLWIMQHLNNNLMPMSQMLNMQR